MLYPEMPFEFLVEGTAVSAQSSPRSLGHWKRLVEAAARAQLPQNSWLLEEPLAVTVYVFTEGVMLADVDNVVKPILDAMELCVFLDDACIERVVVQKFEPERRYDFAAPSRMLESALLAPPPIVYVRVSNEPHEELR